MSFVTYKEASTDPIFKPNLSGKGEFKAGVGLTAVSKKKYSFANSTKAIDQGQPIDVEIENSQVSLYIQSIVDKSRLKFIVVPGFVPPFGGPIQLSETAKKRLNRAARILFESDNSVILTTGGNVKPKESPFNEAFEMKKYLMSFYGVPEHRIAIEPYAQNTVTNLRNSGRFMLAHGITEAVIVTTYVQNIYIGFPTLTLFHWRSRAMLGYEVGQLEYLDESRTLYTPSKKVFEKRRSKVDP